MRSDDGGSTVDAVVIGGGFSGTMIAAQLAKRGLKPILIEGGGRAGRGTAFSTPEQVHLLNVPAARMSAWPGDAEDFEGAQPPDLQRMELVLRSAGERGKIDDAGFSRITDKLPVELGPAFRLDLGL